MSGFENLNCLVCGARIKDIYVPCPACGFDNRAHVSLDVAEERSLIDAFPDILQSQRPIRVRRGRSISLWMYRQRFTWLYFVKEDGGSWKQIDALAFDWAKERCDWQDNAPCKHAEQWRRIVGHNSSVPSLREALETLLRLSLDEARDNDIGVRIDTLTKDDQIEFAATCGIIASHDIGMNRDGLDKARWVSPRHPMLALRDFRFPCCMLLHAMTAPYFRYNVSMEGVPREQRLPEVYAALMRAGERRLLSIYQYIPPDEWQGEPTNDPIYWDYGLHRYLAVGRAPYELDGRTWYRPTFRTLEDPNPESNA